jgi:hypothetical protein
MRLCFWSNNSSFCALLAHWYSEYAPFFCPAKRMRLLVPAVALLVLAIYELSMNQWKKSVRAPIRLDLFLEIPLIAIFIVWGLLALFFRYRRRPELMRAQCSLSDSEATKP